MAFKPITVNTAASEPAHILAEDDAALYAGIIGGDCVLPVGSLLKATVQSNNKVRVSDGAVVVGGHVGRIVKGDYEDLTIANGASGVKRNDIIAARFIAGSDGGADSYSLVVIKGTAAATATDPVVVKGDLYAGDKQRDYPLWRVKIEGLSIVKVEQMYEVGTTNKDLSNTISDLKGKLLSGNYSLSAEVDTGETWIDGKKIYRRTFQTTNAVTPNTTLEFTWPQIDCNEIWIDMQNSYIRNADAGQVFPMGVVWQNYFIGAWVNRAGLRLFSDSGWNNAWTKVVTVRYTR